MTLTKTLAILLISATPMLAQHAHSNHGGAGLAETGQSQFAAIAEIVSVLRDDPATDWDSVDIQALRDHLVDMDNVTTRSTVRAEENGADITFEITGDGNVSLSIQKMVMAHSPMLAAKTGWQVTTSPISNGAVMMITVADEAERSKIAALGFYGVMTIGAHHQAHHLMIATGMSPH
ncbi:hypothetical protein [Planktotalea sp.]|uniref:hypothetical protein n=1 Tax=Planktotalea sp. TaxID=2029877 RepID=UPI0032990785